MSLEVITSCPICKTKGFEPHLSVTDHSVSHGTFEIVRCKKCSFLFTNPRPPEDEIGMYYDSEAYISHHDNSNTLLSKVYNRVRKFTVKNKIDLLRKYDTGADKHVLDVGCGTGFFLKTCKDNSWAISGTEPDDDAREVARTSTNEVLYDSIFHPALDTKRFSSITMWHVLEHVHRLEETMEWVHRHLSPKGTVFIAVPNPQSYDCEYFGPHWAAYDVPRHLYHFTKNTMEKLLTHHNFQLAEMKCMLFDAYYVSLLSNQYKTGSQKPLNSFVTGSLSNFRGFGTNPHNTNTSSIIYIAHKK